MRCQLIFTYFIGDKFVPYEYPESRVASVSLESLADNVRRLLLASKRFRDSRTAAVVAGCSATLESHVRRALTHAHRFDANAGGIWNLVSVQAKVWNYADFDTRLFFNRAVFPSLRATLMSHSAIESGAMGNGFLTRTTRRPSNCWRHVRQSKTSSNAASARHLISKA